MKNSVLAVLLAVGLSACAGHNSVSLEKANHKYDSKYDNWKQEMFEINNAHGEALLILDGFTKKIDHHKSEIASFAHFIANAQTNAKMLNRVGDVESLSALEEDIILNSQSNAVKHHHFSKFLKNLAILEANLENEVVLIDMSSVDGNLPKFESYQQALDYWVAEMAVINRGHNQALNIISNLEDHIEGHENEISMFGYEISKEKKEAEKSQSEVKRLKPLEKRIDRNFQTNKSKHKGFKRFLTNLRNVQSQFER